MPAISRGNFRKVKYKVGDIMSLNDVNAYKNSLMDKEWAKAEKKAPEYSRPKYRASVRKMKKKKMFKLVDAA